MPPPIDNPFLDAIAARRRYRTPGDDIGPDSPALVLDGTWESETASARASINRAAARAGTAPGGYNPDPDILELRGGHKALTSAYGVGVPSNQTLREYHAGREVADRENTRAEAAKTQAGALMQQAQAEKARTSPEAMKYAALRALAESGHPGATAALANLAGAGSPAEKMTGAGLAPSPEKLPKDVDALIEAIRASGEGAIRQGSPTRPAVEQRFGPALESVRRGEPQNMFERRIGPGVTIADLMDPTAPFRRALTGTPDAREQRRRSVAELLPEGAAADAAPLPTQEVAGSAPAPAEQPAPGVGVPQASSAPKAGVRRANQLVKKPSAWDVIWGDLTRTTK